MATINDDDEGHTISGDLEKTNFISGKGGNDTIYGGYLSDVLRGGTGDDYVSALDGSDSVSDESGNNELHAGAGDDIVNVGFAGLGLGATNQIFAEAGDDLIYAGGQIDHIDGGLGEDLVSYAIISDSVGVTVNLLTGKGSGGWAEGDTYKGVEDVNGSFYADVIIGNGAYNVLDGGGGDDRIQGRSGGDYLDGGDDFDTLDYRDSTAGVSIDLLNGSAAGGAAQDDQIVNFEAVWGSDFADTLQGDGGGNALNGFAGGDQLDGGAGADTLTGGAGDDVYVVDDAGDRVVEANGEGTDAVMSSVSFSLAGQYVEKITLTGSADINGTGNSLANTIVGNSGVNILNGASGADTMSGGKGNDDYYV
ncbi:calcium-binding protein, partial [Hansschlegelia plantiphila]|uniref:calcium-binding protein n=1 Tax=Hansschlegelia plantiphila TaxID=374655 RepID=UPI0022F28B38